ncbi:MAG: V-type ATP synthase subunit A [Candidatus Hermodarchaeota archaeon]
MTFNEQSKYGLIKSIKGSLVEVKGLENEIRLHDLIKITKYNILSEVIQIYPNYIIAQCYDDTQKLKLNDKVVSLHQPLSMELGPGLLANVFDGIQRPLETIFRHFERGQLERGIEFPPISRTKKWHFIPLQKPNEDMISGDVIGTIQETKSINHKIMVPPENYGKLSFIVEEGDYSVIDEIYCLKKNGKEKSFTLMQKWPINIRRPFKKRIKPYEPLITGTRIIDLLFPIAKGGTFGVPGGFGTGKTVSLQTIAKYCNADIIVFIGCGEPGNEIANLLKQFSEIYDTKSGRPLSEHIIVIANTSNMPVSAREASLFSGVTIAEYYRDMGYDVAVIADSISRWAESLREISGLLEEMPAEEGYPAYLSTKLSSFYERAGVFETLGRENLKNRTIGSLTIIGSISPPAGDFSEPVTTATKRIVQGLLALDSNLAYLKQYPAIDWLKSYSNYPDYISEWWNKNDINWYEIDLNWLECRRQVDEILLKENDLNFIIQLIGKKNLADDQKLDLFIAKLIRNCFLIQNAFEEIDSFTDHKKLLGIIKIILLLYNEGKVRLKQDFRFYDNIEDDILNDIMKLTHQIPNDDFHQIIEFKNKIISNTLKNIFVEK